MMIMMRVRVPLHLARDADHLVERRRDETAETDDVHLLLLRRVQDHFLRHHHTQVDHLCEK